MLPEFLGLDRWATREKFEEDHAEGVDVRPRVDVALPESLSGLMYTGVPITWPSSVRNGSPGSRSSAVAFAIPKSMTFGSARPSPSATRTFDGFGRGG